MSNQRRTIRQLSASVINKIAAGEVIERPASVLKELLENAVDAGADQIEARLEKGGSDRVRVSDNGCGIPPEEIPLALASHATSKIETADDLFAVTTLGFRGEALASIAEVSHLSLRTRVRDAAEGYQLEVQGGRHSELTPCACAPGTIIDIRNLFFNTPVRRKFMRTVPTELAHATEAFQRIALANPRIRFLLAHNDRTIHDLPPVESWRDRIAALYGDEVAESLIWIESEEGEVKLAGYVANPTLSRSNNKMQYLFLNGRHIRDRSLQHALGEAYRGLLLTGRFPVSFLRIELPPEQIDVNVHPTKLEVRFQDSGRVYSQLLSTLRTRFLSTDLTARVAAPDVLPAAAPIPQDDAAMPAPHAEQLQQDVRQWARGSAESLPRSPHAPRQAPLSFPSAASLDAFVLPARSLDVDAGSTVAWPSGATAERALDGPNHIDSRDGGAMGQDRTSAVEADAGRGDVRGETRDPGGAGAWDADQFAHGWAGSHSGADQDRRPRAGSAAGVKLPALQAHNRYLVTASPEGLVIIDQHALHERILYEQLRAKVLGGRVEVQRLLAPEAVDLAPSEAAAIVEHQEVLAEMGVEVSEFGGSTVLVQGYPAMLGKVDPVELVRQIGSQLVGGSGGLERRDVLDELLHMCSCKAAIKAGDPLSPPEIEALLEFRHLVQDSHHCPHGRPTTLVFTKEELDRRFKRI